VVLVRADDERAAAVSYTRGRDAFKQGDYQAAKKEFTASYLERSDAVTALSLSVTYCYLSDFSGAIDWANKALKPLSGRALDPHWTAVAKNTVAYAERRLLQPPQPLQPRSLPEGFDISATADTGEFMLTRSIPNELPPAQPLELFISPGVLIEHKQTIRIVMATYGRNCGASLGNVTDQIVTSCSGRFECSYVIDYTVLGDPAPGCAKEYELTYSCGASDIVKAVRIPGEAGFKRRVDLSCF
jgi:hypothetical protein